MSENVAVNRKRKLDNGRRPRRERELDGDDPKVYSLLPFIGAIMWYKFRMSQPIERLCKAIFLKSGDVYDSIVSISKMSGGEDAAFALDPTSDPSDGYVAWLLEQPTSPARERSILFYRLCRTDQFMYGPNVPWSLIERDARRCVPSAIELAMKRCEETDDLVGRVFWKYVAATVYACPTGVRAFPVVDSIMCYQAAKCAYETDAYPELTCDNALSIDGAMLSGHRRLVEYYKQVGQHARKAIDAWSVVAIRAGVVRDIRHLINKQLWQVRHLWAGTGVSTKNSLHQRDNDGDGKRQKLKK